MLLSEQQPEIPSIGLCRDLTVEEGRASSWTHHSVGRWDNGWWIYGALCQSRFKSSQYQYLVHKWLEHFKTIQLLHARSSDVWLLHANGFDVTSKWIVSCHRSPAGKVVTSPSEQKKNFAVQEKKNWQRADFRSMFACASSKALKCRYHLCCDRNVEHSRTSGGEPFKYTRLSETTDLMILHFLSYVKMIARDSY